MEKGGSSNVGPDGVPVTSILNSQHRQSVVSEDAASDDRVLNQLGYKQEFKRDFTTLESFAVSFSVLGLLPSVASSLGYGLGYAGTGGAVYGWIIATLCIQATAFSMAELCSSMPTAGGLYYAAAVLGPAGWGPLCSWIVGWSNFLGFMVAPCSINYALAAMLVTAAEIAYPDYQPRDWHIYLSMVGLIILGGFTSMQSTKVIGRINKVSTVWNVLVVIIFVIWLPAGSINTPKTNSNREVWTQFQNGTEWPIGWATIMGFLTAVYTLAGYDVPFHMSEEASNANVAGPRAIVLTAQTGMYLGFAIILVTAYTVKDVADVISGKYSQPFGSLCVQVLGPKSGLALFSLNIIAQFFCSQGCFITASRIVFAFARDGAIPFSGWWSRVNEHTKTPVNATWGVCLVSALLGLLLFGGPVTIGAVFSITAIGQYTSFTFPVALKLFFGKGRFKPGPWNLGRMSKLINAIAVAWWLILIPALCFPAVKGADLTPTTMNWTCLIYGGSMFLALLYWVVDARHWFKGPKINIEHTMGVDVVGDDMGSADEKHGVVSN